MRHRILVRALIDIMIFAGISQGWWFVSLPFCLLGIWYCQYFIEAIVAGVIYDSLFGFAPEMRMAGYIGTIVSVFVLLVVSFIKSMVRK